MTKEFAPHVVRTGGALFEAYLDGLSKWSTHQTWREICKRYDDSNQSTLATQEEEDTLSEVERGGFHGFVLKSCGSVGNNGKSQLFYVTFASRYHGLSRNGSDILAHYGFTTKSTMYDQETKKILETSRQETM
jgi:hypothetical protein